MKKGVQLKYDELNTIVKKMRNEGEDLTTLTRQTREKVHDLYLEWIGEGAEKFFDEMDTKLLPALSRLSQALFASQMALSRIIKVMKDADHETARFFKGDLSRVGLSGMADFGSDFGGFGSKTIPHLDLGGGTIHQVIGDQTGIGGGVAGQVNDVGQQVDQQESSSGSGIPKSDSDISGGSGGGGSGGTGDGGGGSSEAGSGGSGSGSAGTGGTAGASFGSGGVGTGPGSSGNSSGGVGGMQDHIYQGAGSSGSGSGLGNSSSGTAAGEDQAQSGGAGVAAAGAAGAAGAAVGAVKAVRGRKK